MALFLSAREKFLQRFEPHGDGFAYRDTFGSRAIFVTAAERAWLMSEFDRLNDNKYLTLFAALIAAALLSLFFYQAFPTVFGSYVFWIVFLAILVGAGLFSDRRTRAFRRRKPFIDDGLPQNDVQQRERDGTSWAHLIRLLVFNAVFIPSVLREGHGVTRVVLLISAGLAVARTLWTAYGKLRDHMARQNGT